AMLSGADLSLANLNGANLGRAELSSAYLHFANLWLADLSEAKLSHASFYQTLLAGTNLSNSNLSGAILLAANLTSAKMRGAILTNSNFGQTIFANVDLSAAIDLETCKHHGPSTVDHRTLQLSHPLPLAFLRGVGLPDRLIEYLPSLVNQAIQYYSCFI